MRVYLIALEKLVLFVSLIYIFICILFTCSFCTRRLFFVSVVCFVSSSHMCSSGVSLVFVLMFFLFFCDCVCTFVSFCCFLLLLLLLVTSPASAGTA